jgi:hypothetical protein
MQAGFVDCAGTGMSLEATTFQSLKQDLAQTRFVHHALQDPLPGQVVVRVLQFALTANNITYGVAGDTIGYWKFFPAQGEWGCIPVWGFGEIVRSEHPDLGEGTRIYGYFPMATHVTLEPADVAAHGFSDGAAHRRGLPAIYNQYLLTQADPAYQADKEAEQMLYRPLFTTSFLIDDFLADNGFFGAKKVILTSASSKTSIGLAHLLSRRGDARPKVLGLTSVANLDFVTGLGCYDEVVAYDNINTLALEPAVLVDMAGSATVRAAVHNRLQDKLRHSAAVGATHWKDSAVGGGSQPLAGPAPVMFFAPSQAQKRIKELGRAGFESLLASAWKDFLFAAQNWIKVEHLHGEAQLQNAYADFIHGRSDPARGYVVAL